jgi:diaminopimelate decarboxylase
VSKFPLTLDSIAGISIAELVHEFGTPVYVYDAAVIVERIRELAAFDVVRFAQKACSNLAILSLVRQHGVLVDCVSAGEIRRALAAGYQPGRGNHPELMFTADIFEHEALELVVEHGIPVNCGSPDMIDQLGAWAPGREVTLRVNPGFGHGHSQKTNTGGEGSKHGIWLTEIAECVKRAARHGMEVTGLHMHIGSGTDMEHLSSVCTAMEKTALEVGGSLHTISAGGGLPTPYRDEDERVDLKAYFDLWNQTRQRLAYAFGHDVTLELEPGRYVVAESGYLLTEIRAIKHMGSKSYYLVDAGFNNLARPILYGAYHPIAICHRERQPASQELRQVVVAGPLCESGDIFTQEAGGFVSTRELPAASVGDFLIIGCAGAYGAVMGSNYNSKPLAPEVLVEQGRAHLVKKRQTFEELIAGESIPQLKSNY